MEFTIATPEEMEALGAALASRLQAGDLVALNGELGAGKTTLVRGLGVGLGVSAPVTSPTFVLARTHRRENGAPLVHVDAYRLSNSAELDDLDLDFEGSIVAVEWAAGMLDGIAESWIEIGIRRPTGKSEASASEAAKHDDDGFDADEPGTAEPRQVTIVGHGPRFADFRL